VDVFSFKIIFGPILAKKPIRNLTLRNLVNRKTLKIDNTTPEAALPYCFFLFLDLSSNKKDCPGQLKPNYHTTMKTFIFSVSLLLFAFVAWEGHAQKRYTTEEYIEKYKQEAIKNMRLKRIPASITLAQGILESDRGNSRLARKANNHFGIKCHSDWNGPSVREDDDKKNECFRKYKSVYDSYADHADFLTNRSRYRQLFELDITDYKGWARGLKRAGYATNPKYANILIDLIERYNLDQFDKVGEGYSTRLADVFELNKRKAIMVKANETKLGLAAALDLTVKKIERYNELGGADELYEGQLIFLEKKRCRAQKGNDYHTVQEGDTLYSIAQSYGIKYKSLLRKNNLWFGSKIEPGDVLNLRKKKGGLALF